MYKVLLVDDEPYVVEGLKIMIDWGKYGFAICGEATNGEDALKIMKACRPDLVLTDIRMPAMDGLQFIRQARETLNAKAKLVILSGYDDFSYVQYAMRYNVSDYILKPIDEEELNTILEKIGRQIREENVAEERINSRLALVADSLMKRILKGDFSQPLLRRVKRLLDMGDNEEFRCILLEIDDYANWLDKLEEREIRAKKDEIKAVINENLPARFRFRLFAADVNRFCLIVSENMEFYHDINEFIYKLKEGLRERCECNVSVSASEQMSGLESLEQLYQQANLAIYYKFFKGEGSIIYYGDIKNIQLNYDFYNTQIDLLLEDIKHNEYSGIEEKIEHLFHNFSRNRCAPEVVKAYIKNLELEVIKLVSQMNGDIGEISGRVIKFNEKMDYETIGKLKTELREFCSYAAEYIFSTGQSTSMDIVTRIENFVKENYCKDINLQKLARHFYMNPVYLGQLFKKNTGMLFSEYLHQIRIDAAKKLLRRTPMKIAEIARETGYRDPEYFVRKFKAITGVSPSAFKSVEK